MITHHLDISTLMSCAAGSQPEALAAVTVAHLAVCPACSARLGEAHLIGEALFVTLPGAPLIRPTPAPLQNGGNQQDSPAPTQRPVAGSQPALPVVCAVGHDFTDVHWDQVTTGVWTAPVPLSATGHSNLHLLKLAPGITHASVHASVDKLAIILSGSYTDGHHTFRPGDIATDDTQGPRHIAADADTGCICLIAEDR